MRPVEICPNVYWVGVNDRATGLFEGLWPIDNCGISYNAYLIRDDKTALIDLSKEAFTDDFVDQISKLMDLSQLDYVIINHMEPDHSGSMTRLRALAPNARFLGMAKAVSMMKDFYNLTENVEVVKHDQTLSLGHLTLRFIFTPLVHWPETMMTYLEERQVLFSCDGFGAYGALNGSIFDDEQPDLKSVEAEALRYFSNIVAAYSKNVLQAIEKVSAHPVSMVAPSHGPVWRSYPDRIISRYQRWASYAGEPAEPGVAVLYGSMYRNTERAMESALQALRENQVPIEVFNVSEIDASYFLPSLWTKRGILVACPTYERAMFPAMLHALTMAEIKGVRHKKAAYLGSWAWSGGAKSVFEDFASRLEWETLGAVEFNGSAKPEDTEAIRSLATRLAEACR